MFLQNHLLICLIYFQVCWVRTSIGPVHGLNALYFEADALGVQAIPDPGEDEAEGWGAPEAAHMLQSIAEALNLVVWAVVHIQLRRGQQGLEDHVRSSS